LTVDTNGKGGPDPAFEILDKLLAKKRAPDRRTWLQQKGDLAEV
jgi:hypothetical protein